MSAAGAVIASDARAPSVDVGSSVPARWRIEPVWAGDDEPVARAVRGGALPLPLRARFDAPLTIPLHAGRPTMVANFVTTLDGIVALDRDGATGGREISGGFEPDRFLMGLLRASADAVLVGAGTVRASRTHAWIAAHVHPPSADAFARWRAELGLAPVPTTVIVTASGAIDGAHPGLSDPNLPAIIATTARGADRLRALGLPGHVEIATLDGDGRMPVDALLGLLGARGFGVVLSESGPTLFGELLAAGAIDELFLTVAPQLAGRSDDSPRLGLVEGIGFDPASAPWARLRSVMRANNHLFLRYALG